MLLMNYFYFGKSLFWSASHRGAIQKTAPYMCRFVQHLQAEWGNGCLWLVVELQLDTCSAKTMPLSSPWENGWRLTFIMNFLECKKKKTSMKLIMRDDASCSTKKILQLLLFRLTGTLHTSSHYPWFPSELLAFQVQEV